MKPVDQDVRFGQLCVRMGIIQAHELPKLLLASQQARARSGSDVRVANLGQLLVRQKRLSVSEYLAIARESERPPEADPEQKKLDEAFLKFSSGELDEARLAEILRSGENSKPRPKSASEDAPPRFGRYELLGEIARGGMGIVYRARDSQDQKIYALKVMIEADDDEARLARFKVEAELAQKLDHPGIVKVHDCGAIEGMPFFTMDLVEGKSLDDLLEQGIDRLRAIGLLAEVARAVHVAHETGIVHRDLKPGNILIENASGRARITDFGLAREMDRNTRITRVGQAVGTPYYMAPEQVRGERDVDGRADTYAIGVMLYEVLTGDIPFDADSALSLFKKIDREPVNLPLDPERGIDARIHAIVMKSLAKKRDERHPTAKHLADELEKYLKSSRAPKSESSAALERFVETVSRHRSEVGLAAGAALVVVATVAVYGGVSSHLQTKREAEAGEREAHAKLDRARDLVRAGESDLAAGPETAAGKAREAARLVREVELVAQGTGPFAKGEKGFFDNEGAGARVRATASALLGRAEAALGHPAEAESALASAVSALPASPERQKLQVALARLRRARGDAAGALASFTEALGSDQKDVALVVERAELKIESGRVQDGIQDLAAALRDDGIKDDDLLRARLARARALLLSGPTAAALDSAREDAEDAATRAPALPEPLLLQGDIQRLRARLENDPRKARAHEDAALVRYERASELKRGPEPHVRKGQLLLARGSWDAAARAFDAAAAQSPAPRWDVLLGRGLARARRGDLDEAQADLERAAAAARDGALGPHESAVERERARARVLVALAETARARGDSGAARAALLEARRRDPEAAEPEVALGRLDLEGTDPARPGAVGADLDAAATHFEAARGHATADGPDLVDALEGLARVRLARNDLGGASELATRAVEIPSASRSPRAQRALALVRVAQARSTRATADGVWGKSFALDRAASSRERAPDLATALLLQAWPEALAAAAYPAGEGDGAGLEGHAEQALEAVTRLDPFRAPAWLALATLRLARHRLEGARDAALRCAEIDPLRARAHEVAVLAYLGLASAADPAARGPLLRSASEHADAMVTLEPGADHFLQRARLRALRGDATGSAKDLETARGLAPGDFEIEAEEARGRAGTAEAGEAEAKRIREERARDRAQTLARARDAQGTGDDERVRSLAARALGIGSLARDHEAREACLLAGRTTRDPGQRLDLLGQALAPADAALLDAADTLVAPGWEQLLLGPIADRVARADVGDEGAAAAIGLVALEDALAGSNEPRASQDDVALALRVSPASPVLWAAHAIASLRGNDPAAARADLRVLGRIAPASPLVAFLEAELAAVEGDARRAQERLAAAQQGKLALVERRTASSPSLRRLR